MNSPNTIKIRKTAGIHNKGMAFGDNRLIQDTHVPVKRQLKQITIFQSPVTLLIIIILSVFLSEILIMFLLSHIHPFSILQYALLDATLLIILLFPALYFFVLRPLTLHINERKRIEEELDRSNYDLEQFAYAASHDLQEPLRVVAGYVQLLARRYKGKLDANADNFIEYSLAGVKRMQMLIKDLLAYSMAGTQGLNLKPVDCTSVLGQALNNLQTAIEESKSVATHDKLPTITADSSQLMRLFQNLISNAIKFRGKETPRIHIAAERTKNEFVFSVSDNCMGIESAHKDRIFEPFYRGNGKSEHPGTGLGLAICKKIVERHKGRIWVDSEPGKGSTFYFTIPLKD